MAACKPARAKVIKRLENGGVVVEFPVLTTGTLDLSMAAKGAGRLDVTESMLDEIVANFPEWPGPVPITVQPHRSFDEMGGPQPGFIEGLERRGSDLWARCTLNPPLSFEFVNGDWRGFSVDLCKNPKLASKAIRGYCVPSGVFTNRPAAPVNFAVETTVAACLAEMTYSVSLAVNVTPEHASGERNASMSENKDQRAPEVVALESKLTEKDAQITQLEARAVAAENAAAAARRELSDKSSTAATFESSVASLNGQLRARDGEIASLKSRNETMAADIAKLTAELQSERDAQLASKIRLKVREGLEKDIPATVFEGLDEGTDPVAWLSKKFGTFAALETLVGAYPAPKHRREQRSNVTPEDGTNVVAAEQARELVSLGVNPAFAKVNTFSEFMQVQASLAAKK